MAAWRPDLGVRACAEAARGRLPIWILTSASRHQERLRVRVHGDELDPGQSCVDHPVDGVRSAAADADDLDHRQVIAWVLISIVSTRLDLNLYWSVIACRSASLASSVRGV